MINGKVFVSRPLHKDALKLLKDTFSIVDVWEEGTPSQDEFKERARNCMALVTVGSDKVDSGLLDMAPEVKVVANIAVGYDNFDLPAARKKKVILTNTPGVLTKATATLAFALLIMTSRRILEAANDAIAGRWEPISPQGGWLGHDLHGCTLGIVGLGRIGSEMARQAEAFDMKVIYYSRRRYPQVETKYNLNYVKDLQCLLRISDFVSLHVPLTEETRYLIGTKELSMMKPTAILINTARGAVVNQDALIQALQTGTIAGAGLDVTTPEPLPVDSPLFSMRNVVIAPHIGSATHETRREMAILAVRNVIAVCMGQPALTPVDLIL